MKTIPMPTVGQDALSLVADRPHLSADERPLLLGIIFALLFCFGAMLLGNRTPSAQPYNAAETVRLAPSITGKTATQLEAELAHVNEELAQAQAEREAMLKAITEVNRTLKKKLKEAKLEQTAQLRR